MSEIDRHTDLCVRLHDLDKRVRRNLDAARSEINTAQRSMRRITERLKRVSDLVGTMDSLRGMICRLEDGDG